MIGDEIKRGSSRWSPGLPYSRRNGGCFCLLANKRRIRTQFLQVKKGLWFCFFYWLYCQSVKDQQECKRSFVGDYWLVYVKKYSCRVIWQFSLYQCSAWWKTIKDNLLLSCVQLGTSAFNLWTSCCNWTSNIRISLQCAEWFSRRRAALYCNMACFLKTSSG